MLAHCQLLGNACAIVSTARNRCTHYQRITNVLVNVLARNSARCWREQMARPFGQNGAAICERTQWKCCWRVRGGGRPRRMPRVNQIAARKLAEKRTPSAGGKPRALMNPVRSESSERTEVGEGSYAAAALPSSSASSTSRRRRPYWPSSVSAAGCQPIDLASLTAA